MRMSFSAMAASLLLSAAASSALAQPVAATYTRTNLVSDITGLAVTKDPSLVNPWGVAFVPGGAFWVADAGTGVATLYDGAGHKIPATFTVPAPAGQGGPSVPTGIITNPTTGFVVPGTTLPSVFIFATVRGTISAWAPKLPHAPTDAVLAVDNAARGAAYTGLDLGVTKAGTFLYAANFGTGKVDVFDSTFAPAGNKLLGTFRDSALPAGFAPFNVKDLDGNLYVTYAKVDKATGRELDAPGLGLVDVFDTDGHLLRRFTTGGRLNAPWGITRAPFGFGRLSGDVLVGNFGDGLIHAFTPDGAFVDAMRNPTGFPVRVPGLWTLAFGGAAASNPTTLFFTAGINGEAHGLFGSLVPTAATAAP